MNNPKISVLVAVYNVEEFLPQCLDSILSQTYKNLDILVVDDGSKDGSGKICDDYAKKDDRVRVIHQKNKGLSSVRNVGVIKSKGDLICFVDGDDYVALDYVEKLYSELIRRDADVAVCGFEAVPSGEKEVPSSDLLSGTEAVKQLLIEQKNYQIVSWNKLYKKELLKGIEFPVGRKHEDSFTTYKLLRVAKRVAFVDCVLYFYRERSGSIMNTVALKERLETKMEIAKIIKKDLDDDVALCHAAEITELLAVLSIVDNMLIGRIEMDFEKYRMWVLDNKERLLKNPLMTVKLKGYINAISFCGGMPYKVFRKIRHE